MIKSTKNNSDYNFRLPSNNNRITAIDSLQNGIYSVSGIVDELTEVKIATNNSKYRILNINDNTSQLKIYVWEEHLDKIRHLSEGQIVQIHDLLITKEENKAFFDNNTIVKLNPKNIADNQYQLNFYKTKDGHNVRSRGEYIIELVLDDLGIKHDYEPEITLSGKKLRPDWFLPNNNNKDKIIEFWGMEDQVNYLKNQNKKLKIYAENDILCLSLNDEDLKSYRRLQQRIYEFVFKK